MAGLLVCMHCRVSANAGIVVVGPGQLLQALSLIAARLMPTLMIMMKATQHTGTLSTVASAMCRLCDRAAKLPLLWDLAVRSSNHYAMEKPTCTGQHMPSKGFIIVLNHARLCHSVCLCARFSHTTTFRSCRLQHDHPCGHLQRTCCNREHAQHLCRVRACMHSAGHR
jgi:hypothetical protein